ncbi:MAG: MBL fold metallo-hydrolase [Actinomycetota bacterium]
MILRFPGTRGEIEESSPYHRYHSSLVVQSGRANILIDFGQKHNPALDSEVNSFDALLITHAHPDHYIWTLEDEKRVNIPVYLTGETLGYSKNRPLSYKIINAGKSFSIGGLNITAYNVIHSLRCPAVCYKITGDKKIVYAPDLIDTKEDKGEVIAETDALIADGSSLNINMVRKKEGRLFGHTRVKTIIGWCIKYGIPKLIITHCGKQIVTMDKEKLAQKLLEYAGGKVDVEIAKDGLCMNI